MAAESARPLLRPEDLEGLPVTWRQVIPESYLDLMGHMNVMWYTHLFSQATLEFFSSFGMGLDYWKNQHAGTFALEAHIRYLVEIRVGAQVRVMTRAVARSARRIHYMHFLVNEDDHVIATIGEFVSAHIDMAIRRTSPFPDALAQRIDTMCQQHDRLPWDPPLCGAIRVHRPSERSGE